MFRAIILILSSLLATLVVYAQTGPGGVSSNIKLWLKADAGTSSTTDGATLTFWNDQSGNGHDLSTVASDPNYDEEDINFNPSIDFDGDDSFTDDDGEDYFNGNSAIVIFSVVQSDATNVNSAFFDTEAADGHDDNFSIRYDAVGARGGCVDCFKSGISATSGNHQVESESNLQTTDPTIYTTTWSSGNAISYRKDGRLITNTYNNSFVTGTTTGADRILIGNGTQGFWDGAIAEMIFYSSALSSTETSQIESYLALKYGITLTNNNDGDGITFESPNGDGIHEGDYMASDGNNLWDASVNSAYHNDVTGIGEDNSSSLSQPKSMSINSDAVVLMESPSTLGAGDFLLWGNNNVNITSSNTADVPSNYAQRLSRVWRVSKTGTPGTVTVRFHIAGRAGHSTNTSNYALLVSSTSTFSGVTPITSGLTYNNDTVSFTLINFNDDDYFTLATLNRTTTWTGATNTDWATAGNWSSDVPSSIMNVTIPDVSNQPVINSTASCLSIVIDSAASLEINGANTLQIHGNINNDGTFITNNGTVELVGSVAQTISGFTNFHHLTLNNTNGVSIVSGSDSLTGTLTLTNGTFTTNDSLTLISNTSGTARIAEITGGSISGNITMQRYIDAGPTNWRFLSPPISGATLADINDDIVTSGFTGSDFPSFSFNSINFYDETVAGTPDNGLFSATNVTNPIDVGEGLWAWSGDSASGTQALNIDFTGPANTGTINLPVTYTNTGSFDDDGWNMVGNPYPSTIDWDDASITKTNVDNAIYIWDSDIEQYTAYVGGVGMNGGSRYIASSQGFWVKANAASPVLQFTEACKDATDGAFLKQGATSTPLVINVQNTFGTDQTVINFQSNATTQFDGSFDAYKISSSNPDYPYLSSLIPASETEYAINQVPQQETHILIKVTAGTSDTNAFTFSGMENFSNSCIILEDLFTGDIYDLKTTTSFSAFISDTTTNARFSLRLGAPINLSSNAVSCHGMNDGTILLEKNDTNLFDVIWRNDSGSVIDTHTNINQADSITNLTAGNYIIEIIDSSCGNSIDTLVINEPLAITALFTANVDTLFLNESDAIGFTNLSSNAASFLWDFGDGITSTASSPSHEYDQQGTYSVNLVASQGSNCSKSYTKSITVIDDITSVQEEISASDQVFSIYPVPLTGEKLTILLYRAEEYKDIRIQIIDEIGKVVYQKGVVAQSNNQGDMKIEINEKLAKGTYIVSVVTSSDQFTQKLVVK